MAFENIRVADADFNEMGIAIKYDLELLIPIHN